MMVRLRALAALVALTAFSLFWVEAVWASTCATAMETSGSMAMDGMDPASPSPESCPPGMSMPTGDPDRAPSAPSDHCPLVPLGASSCVAGVPLPAESTLPLVPSLEADSPAPSGDQAKDLLVVVPPFHPPRA